VQASTLGSLEALLAFLKSSKIPVSGINIGPVHKKDIIRASIMLERAKEYAQVLAFDVTIDKDAEEMADQMGGKNRVSNKTNSQDLQGRHHIPSV
jgi:translation initiation factor 5B